MVNVLGEASAWQVVIGTQVLNSLESEFDVPTESGLSKNFPNPFNPSTIISYQLPENSKVLLQVFDVLGRQVAVLVNKQVEAGYHQVSFNASSLASDMYIYRRQAENNVFTEKLTLIK